MYFLRVIGMAIKKKKNTAGCSGIYYNLSTCEANTWGLGVWGQLEVYNKTVSEKNHSLQWWAKVQKAITNMVRVVTFG